MFPRGGPRDAWEGSGMPSGEGFGKNTKNPTFWDPHGGTISTPLGAHGCLSGDILASKSSFGRYFFSMFFDIYFLLVFWWICHGFVREFWSDVLCILLIVTLQSIFANCEFYVGKTYDFHVSRVHIFTILSQFLYPNFDVFLGRNFMIFFIMFWDGSGRLWGARNAKKSTKSVRVAVMAGGRGGR